MRRSLCGREMAKARVRRAIQKTREMHGKTKRARIAVLFYKVQWRARRR
jgi:hypothetical protein